MAMGDQNCGQYVGIHFEIAKNANTQHLLNCTWPNTMLLSIVPSVSYRNTATHYIQIRACNQLNKHIVPRIPSPTAFIHLFSHRPGPQNIMGRKAGTFQTLTLTLPFTITSSQLKADILTTTPSGWIIHVSSPPVRLDGHVEARAKRKNHL